MELSSNQVLSTLFIAALASCASGPSVAPIDNALMVEVSVEARASVAEARTARDNAEDAYAAAKKATVKAEDEVEISRASLKTMRSQLDESKLAIEVARDGSAFELESAEARHAFALARADHGRELLAMQKREHELAKLREKLALEEHRLSLAQVELTKAEALKGVDLVAARSIALKDYREQVVYHQGEVETAASRIRIAEGRMDEARKSLDESKRKVDALAK